MPAWPIAHNKNFYLPQIPEQPLFYLPLLPSQSCSHQHRGTSASLSSLGHLHQHPGNAGWPYAVGCPELWCWYGAVPDCPCCGSPVGSACPAFSLMLPPHQLCCRSLWPGCAQESERTARGTDRLSLCCPWPHCSPTATVSTGTGRGNRG